MKKKTQTPKPIQSKAHHKKAASQKDSFKKFFNLDIDRPEDLKYHELMNDQTYFQLVWLKYMGDKRTDPQRTNALKELAFLCRTASKERAEARTPFDAMLASHFAEVLEFPVPPWAHRQITQAFRNRLNGTSKSLDESFGFSTHKGGTSEELKIVLDSRNFQLCARIWALTCLGEGVDSACYKVASYFLKVKLPEWKKSSIHDLSIIKRQSKDPHNLDENATALKAIYYKWKRTEDPEFLRLVKEGVKKDPDKFYAQFP